MLANTIGTPVDALLQRAIAAVQKEGSTWALAFGALPIPVYLTDCEGYVTYFNDACVPFAGRTPNVGEDRWCVTWKLYTEDGHFLPHDHCPMAVAIRERRPVRGMRAVASRPDGTRVRFEPSPTPIFDEDSAFVGAINVLLDISAPHSEWWLTKTGGAATNRLLEEMPVELFATLSQHLESVTLRKGTILSRGNYRIDVAYFLHSALASAAWFGLSDRILDLVILGREHMIGAPLLLDLKATPFHVTMLTPGQALRVDANKLVEIVETDAKMRSYLIRAAASQLIQIAQTATCNSLHHLRHRLPKLLLMCHDQLDNQHLPLSHNCLSGMLGVRRAGVSEAMQGLADKGAVRLERGSITILSRKLLEAECCPCYAASRRQTFARMQRICIPA